MRIGGLASGMDIDSMVSDLMKAERMPLDKLRQQKTQLEWRRDDYRSMNTLFLDFRKELTTMKLSSTFRVRTTSSTDDTRVTATANGSANKSSYSISNVSQLASAETIKNGDAIAGTGFDASKELYRQPFTSTTAGVFKDGIVNNKSITVETATKKLDSGITDFKVGADSTATDVILKSWSVKVNGQAYEVVTGTATLVGNQVRFITTGTDAGKLEFGKEIAKDSTVRVDYVATNKKETLPLTKDTKTWQLSRGAINTITANEIKFNNGGTSETLTISGNVGDVDRKVMRGTVEIGTLNTTSGTITFIEGKLPLPAEGSTTPMSLEITYDQKYTDFSVSSHTSKGKVKENFLIQGNESLNQMINKVNSSTAGVTMFYDDFTKKMTMTRSETGDFNKVGNEIETVGSFINDVLKFGFDPDPLTDPSTGFATVTTAAANSKFTINGLETERSSNTFEMSGVTFTLKKTFNIPPDNSVNPVSVNINNDSNKVFENIKSFVEKYNELIEKVQKKVTETSYKDFMPLTDEQRESLSDKQQEQWEEKSKSGLLKRDSILTQSLSTMRSDFYSPVQNDSVNPLYKQLASIGITTSANYLEGGKLTINEAKLKSAIEADPASVEKLFNAEGTTDSQRGIAQRLYDSVNETMDKLKAKAGNSFSTNQQFSLGKELLNVDSQINRFENRLKQVEDRYWRQFTAMEKAIQRSNEQSNFMMQQFSGA